MVKHEKQEGEFADEKKGRRMHGRLKLHVTTNFVKLSTFFRLFVKLIYHLRSKLYELYSFFSLKELTTLNLSYIDIKMLA